MVVVIGYRAVIVLCLPASYHDGIRHAEKSADERLTEILICECVQQGVYLKHKNRQNTSVCASGDAKPAKKIHLLQVYCWACVADGGLALNQHYVNIVCLVG